jgi:ATP-dependent phosphoenolpyruvate carboxykinase
MPIKKVEKTPEELLMELLQADEIGEGFRHPLLDEFKALLVTKYAKEKYLPRISFTIENGKKIFLLLDKSKYLEKDTSLLVIFDLQVARDKYGKELQYLTPKGDWLKMDNVKAAVPNELDLVAKG